MKQACEKCGCRFDMEEKMYICPACGHYHSQVNQGRRRSESSNSGKGETPDFISLSPSVHKGEKKTRSGKKEKPDFRPSVSFGRSAAAVPEKPSKAKKRICLVLIICMILFPVFSHLRASYEIDRILQSQKAEEIAPKRVSYGETIALGDSYLEIQGIESFSYPGISAPEGWKLMQVGYRVSPIEEADWDLETQISLEADDVYYRSLTSYALSESDSVQEELNEKGLGSYSRYQEQGVWVFLVPAATEACSLRICQSRRDYSDSYSYSKPERIFVMKLNAKGGTNRV